MPYVATLAQVEAQRAAAACMTYLVLPAAGGRMPIVSKRARSCLTLADYRHDSTGWAEAGYAQAATGRLVGLDAPEHVWQQFRACEPIHAPLVVCDRNPWRDYP